jgi:PAS domain S-box-containing protein
MSETDNLPDRPETLAQTVQELRDRETHLLGMLDSIPDSMLGMDSNGMITDWNPGAERTLGWRRAEAMGRRLSELIIPPRYREAHEKGMRRFVEAGHTRVLNRILDVEALHRDGHVFPIELSIWTISGDRGGGFGACVRDASERHRTLAFLRNSEERYRSLVEHLGEGMFVAQSNRIVFANAQASQILHIPNDEMVGSDPLQWTHADDRAAVLELRERLAQGLDVNPVYEVRHVGGDGVERWLGIRPKSVAWEGGMATLTFFSEITESKKVQQALIRSEERYRAVIEHVDSGMVVLQDNHLVYANRRAAEITHMTAESILQVGFLHAVHPDDHAIILDRRQRRLAGEDVPSSYEIRLRFEDGSIRWLELGVSVVPWEGKPATITFFSDVTERKNITLALARSEERYRAVIEHSGEGMLVVQDGRFVFVNHRAAELVQMTREDMLREGYLNRVHPDDRALVDDRRKRRLAGEDVPNRYEIRLLLPGGEVRWIDIGVTVVPWDGVPGTLTFFSDVTERKQAEADLQRNSSEREAILNNAMVGIVLSVNRRHQWVNQKFADMVDYPREELIGEDSLHIHSDRETWEQLGAQQRAALLATGTFSNERQLKRRNGDLFWVQMSGQCVRGKDPDSGVIWTFLDITDRMKAEQNTRAALEQQKELNELRTRFVAMTSHEFRTPLATILSSAELLKYYGDQLPPEEKLEVLQTIENGVHRMTRMLDRVLLLGKAEAQMLEFAPRALDLIALCKSMVDDVRVQLPDSRCSVVTQFTPPSRSRLYDEKLLRHIFGNLLSNAIKYSPNGGQVTFTVQPEGEKMLMTVSDEGIGVPADELAHLFESFHRASNVGDIQGTGLGLAIVKNSVNLHGGTITVRSVAGQGTTFTVLL